MDLNLQDKVAIVTGAGSQVGFGKAICLTLAKEGCDIVASDIDLEGANQTAADVVAAGRKAIGIKVDVTKKADAQEQAKRALDEFGRIDILINNAGGISGGVPFLEQDEVLWEKEINLNLKGCLLCSQAVLPSMIEKKYGKIVNIASDTAKMVWPSVSLYNISKTAVYKFTRDLARMVITDGINVNCVSPGWSLDTNFAKVPDKKEAEKRFLLETPIGRGTTPQDIANAVAFFASDVSSDIVGQILSVSGGSTFQ